MKIFLQNIQINAQINYASRSINAQLYDLLLADRVTNAHGH